MPQTEQGAAAVAPADVIAESGSRSCVVVTGKVTPSPCSGPLGIDVLRRDGKVVVERGIKKTCTLTQEWIDACHAPFTVINNPVALFLVCEIERPVTVSFNFIHVKRDGRSDYPMFILYTPDEVSAWLRDLWHGEKVAPFSFTLWMPESEAHDAL